MPSHQHDTDLDAALPPRKPSPIMPSETIPASPYQPILKTDVLERLESSESMYDRYDARICRLFEKARELRVRKSADYGFSWRALGYRGIFVRMFDKVSRLKTLVWKKQDAKVKDESVTDTMLDLVNYGFFGAICIEDHNEQGLD